MSIIPTSYEEWEHCITVKCRIPLTPDYVAERIEALQDMDDFHTLKFIERRGVAHHERTHGWFREAEVRLCE